MTVILSILVFVALAICISGIYALLFDPKFVDEEEHDILMRGAEDFNRQMTTNLT